jgi:hypothetical protein
MTGFRRKPRSLIGQVALSRILRSAEAVTYLVRLVHRYHGRVLIVGAAHVPADHETSEPTGTWTLFEYLYILGNDCISAHALYGQA